MRAVGDSLLLIDSYDSSSVEYQVEHGEERNEERNEEERGPQQE